MLLAPVQHKLGPRWWLCQRHQRTILLPSAEGYKACSEAAKLYSPPRWHEVGQKAQAPATQPDLQVRIRPSAGCVCSQACCLQGSLDVRTLLRSSSLERRGTACPAASMRVGAVGRWGSCLTAACLPSRLHGMLRPHSLTRACGSHRAWS